MTNPTPAAIQTQSPLWRNVSFMLMWASVAAAGFGDRLIELAAMPLLGIAGEGAQAAQVQAGIAFWFFLPYVIFCPIGGWLADTVSRKWLMFACDMSRAAILLVAVFLVPAGVSLEVSKLVTPDRYWEIYAILFAVGAFAAIFGPTRNAFVPNIVPLSQLQSANAIILGIGVVASLLGFVLASPILEKVSVRAGIALGFVIYFTSGWFFAFMKIHIHDTEPIGLKKNEFQRLYEALGFVRHHRAIFTLVAVSTLVWIASQIFLAAMAAFCVELYSAPPEKIVTYISYLMFALGIGMLLGSLWVAWIGTARESSWFTMLTMVISGLAMFVTCFVTSYKFALVLCFLVGFFGSACMICVGTLMAAITPNYIRGRVFAVQNLVSTSGGIVINLLIWKASTVEQYFPMNQATGKPMSIDHLMYYILMVNAMVLVVVGLVGVFLQMRKGPMPTAMGNVMWRIARVYVIVWHRLKWRGKGMVPAAGPILLVCVDQTGPLTPLILQAPLNRQVLWSLPQERLNQIPSPLQMAFHALPYSPGGQVNSIQSTLAQGRSMAIADVTGRDEPLHAGSPFDAPAMAAATDTKARIIPVRIATRFRRPSGLLLSILFPSKTDITFFKPFRPNPAASAAQNLESFNQYVAQLASHAAPLTVPADKP
jgi:MFS family permease